MFDPGIKPPLDRNPEHRFHVGKGGHQGHWIEWRRPETGLAVKSQTPYEAKAAAARHEIVIEFTVLLLHLIRCMACLGRRLYTPNCKREGCPKHGAAN